jgi:hypothetical protein
MLAPVRVATVATCPESPFSNSYSPSARIAGTVCSMSSMVFHYDCVLTRFAFATCAALQGSSCYLAHVSYTRCDE